VEKGDGAHVLFDEVLRVATRYEREEQDQVRVLGELHRRAGEQHDRESRDRLADGAGDDVRLARAVERRADQHPGRPRRARPQGRRGRGAPGIEPGQHLAPGHRPSSLRTMAEAWARASDSLAGSPAPADAKCARPPPLPPDTAAMAPAISPAFTPSLTRSSVTAT